jgi:hypothetical protein
MIDRNGAGARNMPSNTWFEPTAQSKLASLALWVPSLRSAAAQPQR